MQSVGTTVAILMSWLETLRLPGHKTRSKLTYQDHPTCFVTSVREGIRAVLLYDKTERETMIRRCPRSQDATATYSKESFVLFKPLIAVASAAILAPGAAATAIGRGAAAAGT